MSLFNVLDVAGSGMSAQSVRLNTTASNMANANAVSSSVDETYRARHPVFSAEYKKATENQQSVGVKIQGIVESDKPLIMEYSPDHPMANEEGYIFKPNVNVVEEMADMISASRSYQTNVSIAESAKQMLTRTLTLGQ